MSRKPAGKGARRGRKRAKKRPAVWRAGMRNMFGNNACNATDFARRSIDYNLIWSFIGGAKHSFNIKSVITLTVKWLLRIKAPLST